MEIVIMASSAVLQNLRPPSWFSRFIRRWGVHPEGHKKPACDTHITVLPLSSHFVLPLIQHIGAPARPIVEAGQRVLKGELIACAQGAISAPVHAPTSGTITALCDTTVPHPSGLMGPAILLQADGMDEAIPEQEIDPFTLSPSEIAKRVSQAGIVGLGGATFPSSVKLSLGLRSSSPLLILNGGECEPYLSCDDRIMRERAEGIIEGARIMRHAMGGRAVQIGVEDNKPEAIAALSEAARAFPEITVVPVPSRYPMGSEKQLIHWLTGLEIPAEGRPSDIGVVLHNVGTALAVQQAIRYGRPLISRVVTVNGGAVRTPRNLEVRIGTPASELVAFCGGLTQTPERIVMGGPMMGMVMPHLDVPVIKGTSGILALTSKEVSTLPEKAGPCVRCGSCVKACPIGLLPFQMSAHIRAGDLKGSVALGLKDCIGCGTCAYVCPSSIPLTQYFNHAKGELLARDRGKLKQEATKQLAQARAARMEREAREKAEAAARRKAEREKAKAEAAAAAARAAAQAQDSPLPERTPHSKEETPA
jgi:Na+-translocating ferredoxin:NAD+ oxidoreductase subunit C